MNFKKEFLNLAKIILRIISTVLGLLFLFTAISCIQDSSYDLAFITFIIAIVFLLPSRKLILDYIDHIQKEKIKRQEGREKFNKDLKDYEKNNNIEKTKYNINNTTSQLICNNCGSNNINIQIVEVGSKTKKTENTIFQKTTHSTIRSLAGLSTLGISNAFIPKNLQGQEKTKNKLQKMCICQNCGHSWNIY